MLLATDSTRPFDQFIVHIKLDSSKETFDPAEYIYYLEKGDQSNPGCDAETCDVENWFHYLLSEMDWTN